MPRTMRQPEEGQSMREITFHLSETDIDRLFAIKDLQGRGDLTGNDFARQLLEGELYRLFPAIPKYDENGELINADRYRGAKHGESD